MPKLDNKNDDYYLERVNEILWNQANSHNDKRVKIAEAFRIYKGESKTEEYQSLMEINDIKADGKENFVPYIWQSINIAKNKARVVVEELDLAGFGLGVEAINEEAKTVKNDIYKQVLSDKNLENFYKELEQISGIKFGFDFDVSQFESLDDVRDFFENSFQSNEEIILETLLKYNLVYYDYLSKRMMMFRDMVLSGHTACLSTIIDGFPQLFYVNRLNVIEDDTGILENHADDRHTLIVDYISQTETQELYNVSKKDVEEYRADYVKNTDKYPNRWLGRLVSNNEIHLAPFTNIMQEKNERLLRVRAWWKEIKEVYSIQREDKYGNPIVQNYYNLKTEDEVKKIKKAQSSKDAEVVKKKIETIQHATIIGGNWVVQSGESHNIIRDPAKKEYCQFDLHLHTIDRSIGATGGMMNDVANIQELSDFAFTKMQQEINSHIGNVLVVDPGELPDFFSPDESGVREFVSHLKTDKIAYAKRTTKQQGSGLAVGGLNLSDTQSFQLFVQSQNILHELMKEISGVSDTRSGQFYSKNQLSGPTQMLMQQSFATTNIYTRSFKQFEKRLLNHHLQQVKMMVHHSPDRWKKIIGLKGISHLEITQDLLLYEYGITITDVNVTWEDVLTVANQSLYNKGRSEEVLLLMLNSGKDPKVAARMLIKTLRKIQQEEKEYNIAMQQAASQSTIEKQQLVNQGLIEQEKTRGQYDLEQSQRRDQKDLQKTQMKEANKKKMHDDKLIAELQNQMSNVF